MIGSRNFISHAQFTLQTNGNLEHTISFAYIKELLRQSKIISQIIAFIWLHSDNPKSTDDHKKIAIQLAKYFKENENGQEYTLSQLLTSTDGEPAELIYTAYKLTETQPPCLPIIDPNDAALYDFTIDTSKFEGFVGDGSRTKGKALDMVIPYPPCPKIDFTVNNPEQASASPVTQFDLESWIRSPEGQAPFYSSNPFIPTTCS